MKGVYLQIQRAWAMPSKNTFEIKPIKELIHKHISGKSVIVDPFANINTIATITNDLDPSMPTTYHMDAEEFLNTLPDESADMVLYDPPYSTRQVSECYKKFGRSVNMQTTQNSYWTRQKKEISRILKPGGTVITFGWNSGGIGRSNGFEIVEILMVAHGGWHNDTICTVETKVKSQNV